MKIKLLIFLILLGPLVWSQEVLSDYNTDRLIEEIPPLMEDENWKETDLLLQLIHPSDSLYPQSILTRSYCLLNDERLEEAVDLIDSVLVEDRFQSLDYSLTYNKLIALYSLEDFEGVIETAGQALEKYPYYEKFHYYFALAHFKMENY